MKTKIALMLTIIVVLFLSLFAGCGVSQEEYERLNTQLRASQSQIAELQNEIQELKEKYELVGETPAETAQKIVGHYHETHIYSEYDFFVCSDMALDVWDMLKAQGINALIQIGNVKTDTKDITEADHAWVLAETSPEQYLAVETTGGYAVWGEDNPLYYEGWSFDNPSEYKRFVELKYEYNIRVGIIKQLGEAFEASRSASLETQAQLLELGDEVEGLSVLDPSLSSKIAELIKKSEEYGECIGGCAQLNKLINEQTRELENIVSEMKGLFD